MTPEHKLMVETWKLLDAVEGLADEYVGDLHKRIAVLNKIAERIRKLRGE